MHTGNLLLLINNRNSKNKRGPPYKKNMNFVKRYKNYSSILKLWNKIFQKETHKLRVKKASFKFNCKSERKI